MHFLYSLVFMSGVAIVFSDDCNCRPDQTCCPTDDPSISGCCEYERAVCCSDHANCCPEDYVCDLKNGICAPRMEDGDMLKSIDTLEKRMGTLDEESPSQRVMCDETTYCPFGSTCCTSDDGSYDCCPYHSASCCPDHRHCCPQGSDCEYSSQFCIERDDGQTSLSELKIPSMDIDIEELVYTV